MYALLRAIAIMISPVLTFTAEEAWQHLRREIDPSPPESVQLTDWRRWT